MTEVTHTAVCVRETALRTAWETSWPNHHRACGGTGFGIGGGDLVPYGEGSTALPEYPELCSCLEAGWCPRCGGLGIQDIITVLGDLLFYCALCGWTESNPAALPPMYECLCWEAEEPDPEPWYPEYAYTELF